MDVHVSLVDRRDVTGQIYRQLRQRILDGSLRPGDPLPPTRRLADELRVSRSTVTIAYDRLGGEGFLASRPGSGTFVSDAVARAPIGTGPPPGVLVARRPPVTDAGVDLLLTTPRRRFDLRCGVPDERHFPHDVWRSLVARQLRAGTGLHAYGSPAGHAGLRAAIARHIGLTRAVRAQADDVVVTNGIHQAIDVVGRTLLAPGDVVAVEDPGYPPTRAQFAALGARVVGVPVDDEGIVVDAIPSDARLVVVTPSHQFPTGVVMSLRRRVELLDRARRSEAAIVEDDYDSEFRFGERPIEPLQNLDDGGRVIYAGSFSKSMLPALRLGFVVAPPSVRPGLLAAKFAGDWSTSIVFQAALATFIDDGQFGRHLRRMRAIYRRRHELVSAIVEQDFGDRLALIPSVAGLHVTARSIDLDVEGVAAAATSAGDLDVGVYPLGPFGVGRDACGGPPGLVLGYGAIAEADLPEAMARLRAALDGAR